MEEELKRKDLKIQSLLQKLSQRENEIADLRVELTLLNDSLVTASKELSELKNVQEENETPSDNSN